MGLIVELLVSVLLAVTIGYCVMLDKRLRRFKADEENFRTLVADLTTASIKAETAVPGLRIATAEAEQSLGEKLRQSEAMLEQFDAKFQDGEDVLTRIARIVSANRDAEEAAEATAAAIQAERARLTPANDRSERLSDAAEAARALANKARERKMAEAA